ncbi:MAG: PDZ domain-containing protein [Acidobacteria bacterium]|nr:PDZ domain-containing protein [Acidobacteriota bacterium]
MTTKTRLSVLLISTPVLAFVVLGGLLGRASTGDDKLQHLRVFEDVVSLIMNNYVEEVKVDRVMDGAMRGLADGLDPDSAYLDAKLVKVAEAGGTATGAPGDVGVELTRQYYLRVIAARDGSPAAKAGLQTGDYVRAIDGKPTRDLSVFEGMRMLRGAPGSKVTLTVIRGNAAEPHQIELVREKTPTTALVAGRLIGTDVGYIRVGSFVGDVASRLRSQAQELEKNGATHLVIDLRRAAEGPLDNGLDAARLFVKSGTLALKAGRDEKGAREPISAREGDGAIALPVTLLVTTGTSGAAELFAAALDGNTRADLVGERTLGRAGVQKLVRLPDGRGLWLTYARYLTPDGRTIQGKGLNPDLAVDEPEAVEIGEAAPAGDPVLDAALQRIHKAAA